MQIEDKELQETQKTEYVSESKLNEIVKKYVQRPVDEADRELKMMVLSLVSDLRNCRAECEELKGEVERLNASVEHWAHCYTKLSESKQRLIKQIQNGEEIHFATLDDEHETP